MLLVFMQSQYLSVIDSHLMIVQICHKQYKSATEMETHLSSYDHHHKKVQWLLKGCPWGLGITCSNCSCSCSMSAPGIQTGAHKLAEIKAVTSALAPA